MSLSDAKIWAEIAQAVVTTVGLLAAAVWTIYNFGLTRFSAPKVKMDLLLKSVVQLKHAQVAIFSLQIQNTGRTKIVKRQAALVVRPINFQKDWTSPKRINEPLTMKDYFQENGGHPVLAGHTFIDPDEMYHEEIGIVVSRFDFLQAGIVFTGTKRDQSWEANYLFENPSAKAAG